jgi:hypothetical protein
MKTPLSIVNHASVRPQQEPDWAAALPASIKRRDPRIWQMAYAACARLLDGVETRPRSLVVATALGALDETKNFLDGVFTDGFGSPRNFIASVHNSMAGKLALEFKIAGPNLTFCDGPNSLASSIIAASLFTPDQYPVLVVAVDENIELLTQLNPYLSRECTGRLVADWDDGAAAFLIDSFKPDTASVRATGPTLLGSASADDICQNLAQKMSPEQFEYVAMAASSISFVNPAFCLCQALKARAPRTVIGSHSSSANAVALIDLWMPSCQ